MFVKSIESWLLRTYPSVPLYSVHLTQEGVDHTKLNPYRARVIILWKPDGPHRQQIIGFFEYGKVDMLLEFPVPMPLSKRPHFNYRDELSMDEAKDYIERGVEYPPLDWLLMLMGTKEPESIPFSFIQWLRLDTCYSRVEPTMEDLQNHYPQTEPECWYSVPLECVPNSLASRTLLYPKAMVHVASDDIWMALRPRQIVKEPTAQMRMIAGFTKRPRLQKIELETIDSLELARERMAPCIRGIMDRPTFPSDTPRQYFVRVLRRGKVSLNVIEGILNDKNNSNTPLQRRWDYKAHYEKNYAPPSCEKMNACSLCPMAPGKGLDVKKSQCFKMFMDSFPDKQPHARSFYGPVKWFEW